MCLFAKMLSDMLLHVRRGNKAKSHYSINTLYNTLLTVHNNLGTQHLKISPCVLPGYKLIYLKVATVSALPRLSENPRVFCFFLFVFY